MSVQEREEVAVQYFMDGYNCCQAVAMAFSDVLGLEPGDAARIAAGFGGGFGRMREVCGAVSGMTMVSGSIAPSDGDLSSQAFRSADYALVQRMADKFRTRMGSIICRELLGRKDSHRDTPAPSERTAMYYASRPCAACVGCAARILAEEMENK